MIVRVWIVSVVAALWIVAPRAQSGGRITGTVKLTIASAVPSAASAYESRSVSPRPKALPEMRNVIVF